MTAPNVNPVTMPNTLRISAAQVHLDSFLQHRSYHELMKILNAVAPPFEAKAVP